MLILGNEVIPNHGFGPSDQIERAKVAYAIGYDDLRSIEIFSDLRNTPAGEAVCLNYRLRGEEGSGLKLVISFSSTGYSGIDFPQITWEVPPRPMKDPLHDWDWQKQTARKLLIFNLEENQRALRAFWARTDQEFGRQPARAS